MAGEFVDYQGENSMMVASGSDVSGSLCKHFAYELTDKKAKSNLIKSANREPIEVEEMQKCIMINLSTGAYLEIVIPAVAEWGNEVLNTQTISVENMTPGFDDKRNHVQTIVRFRYNSERITVTCYNTTQRIKAEGKGYVEFVEKFLKPFLTNKLSKIPPRKIEKYNKDVIAVLSGKRKVMSRPTRSVKYKAISKTNCTKCEMTFSNGMQLNKHKKLLHTNDAENSIIISDNIPMVDNISLLDISNEENADERSMKGITLEDFVETPTTAQDTIIDISQDVGEEVEEGAEKQSEVSVHMEKEYSYLCGQCGKEFLTFDECNGHVNTHSSKCYKCEFETQSMEQLRNHEQSAHENSQIKDYQGGENNEKADVRYQVPDIDEFKCNQCASYFQNHDDMTSHQLTHSSTLAIKCDQFDYNAKDVPDLVKHLRIVHRFESNKCKYCEHVARTSELLQTHMVDEHPDVVKLHTMATQVYDMNERTKEYERVLKIIMDNLVIVNQELFLIRNEHHKVLESSKKHRDTENINPEIETILANSPKETVDEEVVIDRQVKTPEKTNKTLFIGDSVSANVDISLLEKTTQTKFVTAKAYSSIHDTVQNAAKNSPRFPKSNYTDVIIAELNKDDYQTLVIQAGSVDITNLNTKDNPTEYLEYFKQETIISAKNLFQAAVNGLVSSPSLKNIILMKQIPRYDPIEVDPLSLKPALSQLYNNILTEEWMNSEYKDKIMIGTHNIECSGAIQQARYRETRSGKFDGIHMFGPSGRKFYTLSVLNIFKKCKILSTEYEYHQSCPQFRYQQSQRNKTTFRKTTYKKTTYQKATNQRRVNRNSTNQMPVFSLPTENRFAVLSRNSQGNW